jgi:hypothetical protein
MGRIICCCRPAWCDLPASPMVSVAYDCALCSFLAKVCFSSFSTTETDLFLDFANIYIRVPVGNITRAKTSSFHLETASYLLQTTPLYQTSWLSTKWPIRPWTPARRSSSTWMRLPLSRSGGQTPGGDTPRDHLLPSRLWQREET